MLRVLQVTYFMHVIWGDNIRFLLVEHDNFVILLPRCGQVVEVYPDVSVAPGLQVHGEHQRVPIVQEVVDLVISGQGGDHWVIRLQAKVLARLILCFNFIL